MRHHKQSKTRFDVFLIHRHSNGRSAFRLGQRLRAGGFEPWIDREQMVAGEWFQDALQRALNKVLCAAILIGRSTPGGWQDAEIRVAISDCIERNIRVIPVLLPGVSRIPESFRFLQEMHCVRFERSISDPEALRSLMRGISAARARRRHAGLRKRAA